MRTIEIIIARYNEDLKWTTEGIFNDYKYIVYNKGDNENFEKANVDKIINVKNVGRCDHTYLYHIITNYSNLADINVFFPGSLDLEYKKKRATKILTKIRDSNHEKAFFLGECHDNVRNSLYDFKLDNWKSSHTQNFEKNDESKLQLSHIRPFGKWFDHYYGNIIVKQVFYCSIFSFDKRDIIQHPINRYIVLINQVNTSSNPEIGHYLERSWCALFNPINYTEQIVTRICRNVKIRVKMDVNLSVPIGNQIKLIK